MENTEPNKIVSRLWKRHMEQRAENATLPIPQEYWDKQEQLKKELRDITRVVGAIEVMSKNNLLKLVTMQSRLRFMEFHSFGIHFDKATEDLNF